MANRMKEYNRGRDQGLDMAYRLVRDAGEDRAAALIAEEIRKRGRMPIQLAVTSKEIEQGLDHIKKCMYESFLCQTLMVLRDQFDFGRTRCLRFMNRWNFKTDLMSSGFVNWADYVETIKEEMDIDVPTASMREEKLL